MKAWLIRLLDLCRLDYVGRCLQQCHVCPVSCPRSCHVCLVHGLKSSALPATLWPSSKLYHNDYLLRALAASRIMELDLSRQSNDECCLQTSSEPILRLSSPDPGRGALRPWSSSINMVPKVSVDILWSLFVFASTLAHLICLCENSLLHLHSTSYCM